MNVIIMLLVKLFFIVFVFYQTVETKASLLDVSNLDEDELIVTLLKPSSKIRGHRLMTRLGQDYYAFQDIPYAQAPIGKNRFKPAIASEGWPDILDATSNKKKCFQPGSPVPFDTLIETEDCLLVNVYTPVKPGTRPYLPVYFWIHGGGFNTGNGAIGTLDPRNFMDYDVIVVTINYRLGVLGFLSTDDESIPGNLGLKDQQFALKWTYDNIKAFGGDPKKITIGGESAGASSVSYHLLHTGNKDLIKGIIQESGSALNTFAYQINCTENAFTYARLLDQTFASNSSQDLLELLQKTPAETLIETQSNMHSGELLGFMSGDYWKPIIESDSNTDAYVTGPMQENFMQGNFLRVPSFVGFNSEESLTFLMAATEDQYEKSVKQFDEHPELMISNKLNTIGNEVKDVVHDWKKIYTDVPFAQNKAAFVKYSSDAGYIHPLTRQAELTSQFAPVYMYQFAYGEPFLNVSGTEHVGHAEELMYLWNLPFLPVGIDEQFRTILIKFWTNFITYQNPTPHYDDIIYWPKVDPENLEYLNINETLEIRTGPRNYLEVKNIRERCIIEPYTIY
ncbi:juvenile hormone esterase isoform X1 [Diabrotica virgifera virgifera]|uniref:Carboxylic ester hydrolase n=1 Tax=Diabrotica virgifera virgifera TaxID=50390 RepID=A0ABM5JU90_DIAVI|nr:juvenile hormone esterase isoform X1 [Diabrotica virgifera virgifera]